jgi:hypothetical protein
MPKAIAGTNPRAESIGHPTAHRQERALSGMRVRSSGAFERLLAGRQHIPCPPSQRSAEVRDVPGGLNLVLLLLDILL